MPHHYHFTDAEQAAIHSVPFEHVPVYFDPDAAVHPWRPWHHARYGGSPIPICLDGQFSHTSLYLGPSRTELGDIEHPDVESIVNLCELEDQWPLVPDDRRWPRGEGPFGYTWQKLDDDAREVAQLLRAGKRVVIHCMAGVNRSPTLTCAVLMHIEGIGAAEAMRRVQRFHPPTKPEDRHWQALRQLELALRAERAAQPAEG
jgi:protein-tyrosine phosphatase